MSVSKRNKPYFVLIESLRIATALCATGTLMQTFLDTLGFSEDWIYLYSTLIQVGQICSILLNARWADRGNLLKRTAGILLLYGLPFFCYLPLCLNPSATPESFLLLLVVGCIQAVINGIYTVCCYKLPYHIFEDQDYGPVMSLSGVMSGVVSFALGALVSYLSATVPYSVLMLAGFLLSGLFMLISALLQLKMEPLEQPQIQSVSAEKQEKIPLKTVLLAPIFRNLAIPGILRGFTSGCISVLPVMALSMGYGQTVATAMVSIHAAASLAGSGAFGLLSRRTYARDMIFFGSLCQAVLLAMLLPGAGLFLTAYCVVIFGKFLVDNAVPAALLWSVPVNIAGPYNAWRMILQHVGMLLGTAAATVIPIPAMLALSAGMQVISGWVYQKAKVMHIHREQQEV